MTRAAQIAALMAEARDAGKAESLAFARALDSLARKARALSAMGEAVPVGARELASRIETQSKAQAATVRAIAERSPQ